MFGRLVKVRSPYPYGVAEYMYLDFGDPYNQRIREEARDRSGTLIHWEEGYFDGLGRTRTEVAGGPNATAIYVDTEYNEQGLVDIKTYPYFEGDPVHEIIYEHDPVGRLITTDYPDGTWSTIGYDRDSISYIDPNGHKKEATKDIYGRIVSIEEYSGEEPDFNSYATTTYKYDELGNLTEVTDANGNVTSISYNSLSRKIYMSDPDMSEWYYDYDANGNLVYQKDAKGQEIFFQYDALNRITLKDYPTGIDTAYFYDESWSSNSKGHVTTVTDRTGSTKFWYDELGQIARSVKTVVDDPETYTTQTLYDELGRVERIIYPDGADIFYTYDGNGNVKEIKSWSQTYVTYESYTAIGTPLLISFYNGVTTEYEYDPLSKRLISITTTDSMSTTILTGSWRLRVYPMAERLFINMTGSAI
jgi:YD repeat-containing protein